ncbi:oxidoreductase [Actinacidiphila acididurans]|uniref:SDR family NAD(P)-dependent oxidoreductase n=1 Tax=Actinacidiphila acididurans TaxID=2784346 RepID=A0ABS2U241_9ACTN|nr:oxidoreductase [Actinacidiphila acididurans]MBM9509266.1 SDR family NAD(P)-dependent oxidoreductase [Actinacidiphila acididurans]
MPTPQTPLRSGFGAASTTSEVIAGIDLSGRTAIVTGGYSGLGRQTVRTFTAAGAQVVVPARDVPRAEARLAGIDGVQVWPMDLLDPASIDAFADRFLATGLPLHLLVNSAGIMAAPLTRDARGFESQFATNHLGHFLLTARLWLALAAADGARVVQVSSLGHRYSPVLFDDPGFERHPYDPWAGYGQSKTANILFALALDERGQASGVRAFSCHPGSIAGTGLEKHVPPEMLVAAGVINADGTPVLDPARGLKTPEQGAATLVWAATSPALAGLGGVYCENCDIAPVAPRLTGETTMADGGRLSGVQAYAVDPDAADRLWSLSEQLLGITFSTNRTNRTNR